MFKYLAAAFALLAFAVQPLAAQDEPLPPEAKQFVASLHPQSGKVAVPAAEATLDLGDDYLFYGPEDAATILQVWGNPAEATQGVLGLVMPANTTPFSETWGAVVTYEDTGYVSDDDAAEADYDAILDSLRETSAADNESRRAAGLEEVAVVGWAQEPHYDAASHSVVWARDLKFGNADVHTLNYDLRSLGRRGVLSMNLVSVMPDLAGVRTAANQIAARARFDPGARYEDFDSSIDRKAEYGVAGLVAAGVGVAAAKKLGLAAILLKFLKPILIGLAVFFGAMWRRIRRLFGFGDDEQEEAEWADYAHAEEADDLEEPLATDSHAPRDTDAGADRSPSG